MNIIEAIKTGKRFKRKSWSPRQYCDIKKTPDLHFLIEEVMANDWEIEPYVVTITRDQFNRAWDKGLENSSSNLELHAILCEELGI